MKHRVWKTVISWMLVIGLLSGYVEPVMASSGTTENEIEKSTGSGTDQAGEDTSAVSAQEEKTDETADSDQNLTESGENKEDTGESDEEEGENKGEDSGEESTEEDTEEVITESTEEDTEIEAAEEDAEEQEFGMEEASASVYAASAGTSAYTPYWDDPNYSNLIVFVDYADTVHEHNSSYTSYCTSADTTLDYFNGSADKPRGMRQYLYTISYGKLRVENIFPQYNEEENTITPYHLSQNGDYYASNEASLVSEVVQMLNASGQMKDNMVLDLSKGDDVLDNLTIVVPCDSGNQTLLFGAHKTNYGGIISINGNLVSKYNILTEGGIYFGYKESGQIIHEFLHTVGYPDLYCNQSGTLPVGYWDIMSSCSYAVQYPLAYLRSAYTGWFDMDTLKESTEGISLYAATAATEETKNQQALILKTDYSDTEFFVVEYRKKSESYVNGQYYNGYDAKIPGSGLIVYRVNTMYQTNMEGKPNWMIYVFRPGDSYDGGEACGGDVFSAHLSAETGRVSYGSSDFTKSLADGAITYSDGTNSGIVISNVGSAQGDQITFDVTFTEPANGANWKTIAETDMTDTLSAASYMAGDGTFYYLLKEGTSIISSPVSLYQCKDNSFTKLGTAPAGSSHQLTMYNGEIYIAYLDSNYTAKLAKWNGSSWNTLHTSSVSSNELSLTSDEQGVYLAYSNADYTHIYAVKSTGSQAVSMGTQVCTSSGYASNPSISAENGTVAVMYREAFNQNRIYVKLYDKAKNQWNTAGTEELYASNGSIKIHDQKIYMLKNGSTQGDNACRLYVYNLVNSSAGWQQVGDNAYADVSVSERDICFVDGEPYIVYMEAASPYTTEVKHLKDNAWVSLGGSVASGNSSGLRIYTCDDQLYATYLSGITGHVVVRRHESENTGAGGMENPDTGDDSWVYDETSRTLTLTDYVGKTITSAGTSTAQIYADGDLHLVLQGNNQLSFESDYGIYCKGNLTITGSGSLTLENSYVGIYAEGTIRVEDASVTVDALETAAVMKAGNLSVSEQMAMAAGNAADSLCGISSYNGEPYLEISLGNVVHFVTGTSQEIADEVVSAKVAIEEPEAVRRGYSLTGWYTSQTEQGEDTKWDFDTDKADQELTLYAGWQANTYTVTFAGEYEGAALPSLEVVFDSSYGELPVPVREGYDFDGWFTEPDKGEKIEADSLVDIEGDHTLYAHFSMVYFQVIYKLQGGSFRTTDSVVFDIPYHQSVMESIGQPEEPVRTRYRFTGWYTSPKGGEVFDFDMPLSEDVSVYAHWEAMYTVSAPEASIAGGTEIEEASLITLKTATLDGQIYYTTDGTEPSAESSLYTEEIVVKDILDRAEDTAGPREVTIKAVAVKDGYADSDIVTFAYTVKEEVDNWGDLTEEDRALFASPADIPDSMWIAGVEDQVYTGANITLALRVYDHKTLLQEKTDYTVSYRNNKNVNDGSKASKAPAVVITGKGNYSGKLEKIFKIQPADISEEAFRTEEILLAGSNKVQKQAPVLYYGAVKLRKGTDYTLAYPDTSEGAYQAIGQYTITITGKGNYTGTRNVTEEITGKTLVGKLSVASIANQSYTGSAIEPVLTVKDGAKVLNGVRENAYVEGETEADYTYAYEDNTDVGTASVVITGRGSYAGMRTVTFKITGIPFSRVKINQFNGSCIYTGKPVTQESVTLTRTTGWGASAVTTVLEQDVDYTVSYSNNENAGTATVVYTGIGGYTGTQKKTFSIKPYNLNEDTDGKINVIYAQSVAYAKGGAKPVPKVSFKLPDGTWKTLTAGVDYTLSYTNNGAVNDGANEKKLPLIVMKGKGNFTGTRQKERFTIESQSIAALVLSVPDKVYADKKNNFLSTPVVTDLDGKALKAGSDYDNKNIRYFYEEDTELADGTARAAGEEISSDDIVPAGTQIRVRVTGKGYYTDSISGVYRMVSGDIAKAKVKVNGQYYTGQEVRPRKNQISVTLGGKLLSDQDYEITGYTNNTNKGTGKITIHGIGDYGGYKTAGFSILDKSMYYIVSFNGNQATSGSMKNMQLSADKEYMLTNNTYKRGNYVFTGWNTKADGTGIPYENKGTIRNAGKENGVTVVLYAQWEPVIYTITYHLAGGQNNAANTKTTYTADDRAFTIEAPEREKWPVGYQFGGWYQENTYKNKISVVKKGSGSNLNLYAKWIPYTYTVSFDGNGATGGTVADETFSYGVSKVLTANRYKRKGYVFLGWASSKDADKPEYTDKEAVCDLISRRNNVNGKLTLYAVWENQFQIVYDTNGGVLDASYPDYADSYTYGKKAKLPTPVRAGYSFDGWYRDTAFKKKVTSISGGMSGDLYLTAKWTPYNYTIAFNGNGQDSGSMANQVMDYDTGKALRRNAFVKKGYRFMGWSTSKDGAVQYGDEETVNILPAKKGASITLYAVWESAAYNITYVTNGGTLSRYALNYRDTYEYNHDGGYGLPTPTRKGYEFAGWYQESSFKNKVASIAKTTYGDLTLYAKWTADYTVNYVGNGSDVTGTMASQSMKYETASSLRKNSFKKNGYVFMGWSTSPEGEVIYTNAQKIQYPPEAYMTMTSANGKDTWVMTLYAVWKNQFTITYHADNGTEDNTELYTYGTGKAAGTFPAPVRDGFTFAGWYKEPALKNKITSISKTNTGDMDLYAKWNGKNYQVTFAADAPDGKAVTGKMNQESLTYGTAKALTANAFRVTGYTFLGWSITPFSAATQEEKADPSLRIDFQNAEKITGFRKYGDYTLYAVWQKDTYAIVYHNMSGIENPNPDSYNVDDTVALREPERMGYTFLGWYTDAACRRKAADIQAGTTGNKTYYAKWAQVN